MPRLQGGVSFTSYPVTSLDTTSYSLKTWSTCGVLFILLLSACLMHRCHKSISILLPPIFHICVLLRHTRKELQVFACSSVSSGEGNGTPLQYFCLENTVDGEAWWAAVHGAAQSWTRLKRLSSSSSSVSRAPRDGSQTCQPA